MDFFKNLGEKYDEIWKNIISPQRQVYFLSDLEFQSIMNSNDKCYIIKKGNKVQIVRKVPVLRYDLDLKNNRGQILKCSFYYPEKYDKNKIGCVIYLHGNAGSRIEALTTFNYLLPRTALFCFDFAGAGKSDGQYVTLGINEAEDLAFVIEYIKTNLGIQKIALWGRSMGAATAINYCANNPNQVVALALDSGFIKLSLIMEEIGKTRTKIPNILVDAFLHLIKKQINDVLKKDIFSLDLIEQMKKIKDIGGIIFGSSEKDSIINTYHTQKLFEEFQGDKQLIKFEGDHNTIRPPHFLKSISSFLETRLYGQETLPLPTLSNEEQQQINQVQANKVDVSFHIEDQFINPVSEIPLPLDKFDQLVENCIHQLEHLTQDANSPFNNKYLMVNQNNNLGQTQHKNNEEQYYLPQKYYDNIDNKIIQKSQNSNSFNNTKRIKNICTNQSSELNNGGLQQINQEGQLNKCQNDNNNHISGNTKGISLTYRNDLTHSYSIPAVSSSYSNFDPKSIQLLKQPEDQIERSITYGNNQQAHSYSPLNKINQNRGQSQNKNNENMQNNKKEELLKRVFDEMQVNSQTQHRQENNRENQNNFYQNNQNHQYSQNNRYQENYSKSPFKKNTLTTQNYNNEYDKLQKYQMVSQQQQQQKSEQIQQEVVKENGRCFPQKLLKQNLLNENVQRNVSKDNVNQANSSKILTVNNISDKGINQNTNRNLSFILTNPSPSQQNPSQKKINTTPYEGNSNKNTKNLQPGIDIPFGSFIQSQYNKKNIENSSSPLQKSVILNNNMVNNKNQSFKDYCIEDSEILDENLGDKEAPKHSGNVRTLLEIKGVDNKKDSKVGEQKNQINKTNNNKLNEQQIQSLLNKYTNPHQSYSPNNISTPTKQQAVDQTKPQNQQILYTQDNIKQPQQTQSSPSKVIKQLNVLFQDSQFQNNQPQQSYSNQQNNPNDHNNHQINTFRRATLDLNNQQMRQIMMNNNIYDEEQLKLKSNINQNEAQGRQNIHQIFQNNNGIIPTSLIGQRINLHTSCDKNSKERYSQQQQQQQQNNNFFVQSKNNLQNNQEVYNKQNQFNIFKDNVNISGSQSQKQFQYNFGMSSSTHKNQQQNQQNIQFNQGYQNQEAINFKNIQHHQIHSNQNIHHINQQKILNHQNSNQNNAKQNNDQIQSTEFKGISLLQNQQPNFGLPQSVSQMSTTNSQQKLITLSSQRGQQGIQILSSNQNYQEEKQRNSFINKYPVNQNQIHKITENNDKISQPTQIMYTPNGINKLTISTNQLHLQQNNNDNQNNGSNTDRSQKNLIQ